MLTVSTDNSLSDSSVIKKCRKGIRDLSFLLFIRYVHYAIRKDKFSRIKSRQRAARRRGDGPENLIFQELPPRRYARLNISHAETSEKCFGNSFGNGLALARRAVLMQFGETLSNYSPAGTPDQDIDVVSLRLTRDTMDAVIRVSRDFVPLCARARARAQGVRAARSTGISFLPSPSSPSGGYR